MTIHTMLLRDVIISLEGREKFYEFALSDYPIFDENYRRHLNDRIVEHYWLREIGQETVEQFIWYMKTTMNEFMPIANGLYATVNRDYDFLANMSYENVLNGTVELDSNGNVVINANSKATNNTDAKSTNYAMPNTQLVNNRKDYATDANRTVGENTTDSDSTSSQTTVDRSTNKQNTITRMEGRTSSPSQLIAEYRQNLISVDREVIDALADCFMGIWYNGDDIKPARWVPFMNYGVGYGPYYYI